MTTLYDPSTIVAPPTPNPNNNTAADWANYYAFWRIQAEYKIADSNRLLAEAQQAVAAAIVATSPAPAPAPSNPPSDPPPPVQPGPTPAPNPTPDLVARTVSLAREWQGLIKPSGAV